MLKQLRILATSLAAFYTICAPVTAQAEESSSQSTALISNIRTNQKGNWTETVELIFDYLFLLKEEGKTSKERVEALLALYEPDPVNKGLFKFSAVSCAHWLMVLKDFHVENFDDIRLLNQALAKFVDAGIQNVPSQDSAWLLNLGRSVLKVEASSKDALKVKVSTLRQLALLTQKDKYVGRQLGVNALEQMADCGDVSEYERRDLISRVFLSYTGEQPGGNDDGDLLFRDVIAAAKIVHQTKSRYDFSNLDGIYNEVCRRCTDEQALAAQRVLVEEAHLVGLDGEPLHALLLQLTNALLSAGRLDEAVDVLSKQIKKPQPIDNLVLSACLLKQSKYAAAEKLAHQVAVTRFPINEKYPSHYVAMASAIRAHALIEQRNYFGAIELLIHADSWFSKSLARQHEETEGKYPFFKDLLPSDTSILSDLAMVYEKTGRKSKADRTRQALAKLKLEKERNSLAVETNALTQFASSESGETLATVKNAKRFIGICPQFEKVPEKRLQLILGYIEALIRSGKLISAQMCIDACSGAAYAPTNSQPKFRARIIVDNILLKIEKDNLVEANELMKGFLADAEAKAAIDDLRFAEVDARLSLLSGDYARAESKSRVLQAALDACPEVPSIEYHSSPRDELVTLHPEAILDRAQILNHLKKYSQAAKLSRLLLLNSDRFI
ncbi:MAG: hypothetical protein C0507_12780, partial [Cyanobacteria bacterium PR.3.49]|nr:hypothetical protein [Cyanobacteria bacterium PR.3.49]